MTITPAVARPQARHTSRDATLPGAGSVLVVTARPGQESVDLGGVVYAFARAAVGLSLLCLTRGEAAAHNAGSDRLEAVRPWEVQLAASVLGIDGVAVASYRDGALPQYPLGELAGRIGRAIRDRSADLVLVVAPEAGDGADAAVARAARVAAEAAGLPAVAVTRPGEHGAWTVDLGLDTELARAIQKSAIAAHASQSELLPSLIDRIDRLGRFESLRWLLFPEPIVAQPTRQNENLVTV
jgi:N-acetylglucosamine malate deacetylase 2